MTNQDYYDLLISLQDKDVNGTRSTEEANTARSGLARKYGIPEKEIIRFCKLAHKMYKAHGLQICLAEKSGTPVLESILGIAKTSKNPEASFQALLVGYLFHENEYARHAVIGKSLVKYTRDRISEIFSEAEGVSFE